MKRRMIKIEVVHDGGYIEDMVTDDPKLLGEWLIYTAHKMPDREKTLRGNWNVIAWELADS